MPKTLEKDVENYLKQKIKERNGLCYKWRAQDRKGVPDRVCVLPWMGIFFVEVKTERGKPTKLQEHTFEQIKEAGGVVFITNGKRGVDKLMIFLDNWRNRGANKHGKV